MDIAVENPWDSLCETATCPGCKAELTLEYDEDYDPETGDTWGWFYFEPLPLSVIGRLH